MLVEDARRLFISNLDLETVTRTWGEQLAMGPSSLSPEGAMRSLSAVEFFRVFPQAQDFQVGTAARINASFPIVGPGVSLPTFPPRRAVDAGYYDNYGVDVAGLWLYRHRRAIRDCTSGVALVEIRAYRNGYARRHFQDQERPPKEQMRLPEGAKEEDDEAPGAPPPRKGLIGQSIEWASTPAEAILAQRDRAAWYRNDELLNLLNDEFAADGKAGRPFITTVAFECDRDAALSWYLPRAEATDIVTGFYKGPERQAKWKHVQARVGALKDWFGDGGR
jgi:hypothetical protein